MGFYLAKIKDTELHEYIGSQTIHSCANNGAFDSDVFNDLQEYADLNNNVMAIVDSNGVEHFINTLKNGKCVGRDIELLINVVTEKYSNGFMVIY